MLEEPNDGVFEDNSASASSSTLTEDKVMDKSLEAMLYAELSPAVKKKVVFANRAASSDDILTASDYPTTSHYDHLKPQRDWSSVNVLNEPRSILAGSADRSVSKATQLWRELVLHLHQEMVTQKKYPLVTFRYYDDCFFGSELIDCMVPFLREHSRQAISRSHILTVCHRLLISSVMINVQVPSNTLFQELNLYRFPNRPSWTETDSPSEDSSNSMENKAASSRLKCVSNIVKSWKKLVRFSKPEHGAETHTPKRSSRVMPSPQKVLPEKSWERIDFGTELKRDYIRAHSSPQMLRKSPAGQRLWRSASCSSLSTISPAANRHKDDITSDWKIYGYV